MFNTCKLLGISQTLNRSNCIIRTNSLCQFSLRKMSVDKTSYWKERLTKFKINNDEPKSFYNEWASDYEKTLVSMGWDAHQKCVEYFIKNNKNTSNKSNVAKILDISCGPGLVGKTLKEQCKNCEYELFGCDIAQNMLKESSKLNIYKELKEMDFNIFPYDIYNSNSFDHVICSGALSYCNDMESFLNECLRITKYNALIVLSNREDLMKNHLNIFNTLENEKKLIKI
eukprot:470554_1